MPKIISNTNLSETEGWYLAAINNVKRVNTEDVKVELSNLGFGPVHSMDDEEVQKEISHLTRRGLITQSGLTRMGKELYNELKNDPTN